MEMDMEVILLERVGRLGTVGDVVKVKNGYGRNFLLPQNKALRATKESKALFEAQRAGIEAANTESRAAAQKQGEKLKNVSVKLVRQASEDGKLYGSVNVRDIAEALQAQGQELNRKQLELSATIKNTGVYTAKIILHPEVVLPLSVIIVRNESDIPQDFIEEAEAYQEEEAEA
jgi:large subunit ribosomal protein L9